MSGAEKRCFDGLTGFTLLYSTGSILTSGFRNDCTVFGIRNEQNGDGWAVIGARQFPLDWIASVLDFLLHRALVWPDTSELSSLRPFFSVSIPWRNSSYHFCC